MPEEVDICERHQASLTRTRRLAARPNGHAQLQRLAPSRGRPIGTKGPALLIRPDGCVAWALPTGQDLDATTLVRALGTWFGQPA